MNPENKQLRKGIMIGAIIILATIGVIFLASNQYTKFQDEILLEGGIAGYERAIIDILSIVTQCKQIPIIYQNETLNLFLVECLQNQEVQG